jgi:hypothetical protein
MIKIGTKVICRGKPASEFSLAGVVEDMIPENPRGVYAYGIRLVNGNYAVFEAERVRVGT